MKGVDLVNVSSGEAPPRRTLCVFTGTRAEYGLLKPLMQAISGSDALSLKLLVTGAHLAPSQGMTWRAIEKDGFVIDERVEILMDGDSPTAIATAMGLATMRYAPALERLSPDAIVILGDRFEAFSAAAAATVCHVPVIHLHGGEITLGAMDEVFRHAITKMSGLHFTSTAEYRDRVVQLGEAPDRVFNVGALGVANALALAPAGREAVLGQLGLPEDARYLLVTFHPATTDRSDPALQLQELLAALDTFPELCVIFTGANADLGGWGLNDILARHIEGDPTRLRFFHSLGMSLYLSAVRHAEAVVGNSSSGIIEVPSLGIPVVDIGSRQQGRVRAPSVLHALPNREAIGATVRRALSPEFRQLAASAKNPYEKADTVSAILAVIEKTDLSSLSPKVFYDLTFAAS